MRYRINLTTWASTVVEFESDATDPREIASQFYESATDMPTLCHQCTGSVSQNLELGNEWEISTFDGKLQITPVDE